METRRSCEVRVRCRALVALATIVAGAAGAPLAAQTISGTLLDLDTSQPIPLGLVMMYTEAGDSITATVSDGAGRFTLSSPAPGSFLLNAAALGYRETPAGVFELGDGASMSVEYRLPPAPLPIDALVVSVDRPVLEHHLVRNGFVRRLQRGLGRFITPYEIERSPARSTESLLIGIPSVRVATVTTGVGGLGIPATYLGETVQIAGPDQRWCSPRVYVDGLWSNYAPDQGFTLSMLAGRDDVEAIEVYRRGVEIPPEFRPGDRSECGVLVVWTKQGLAAGQRPEGALGRNAYGEPNRLPRIGRTGAPPVGGERIRMDLNASAAEARGLSSPWEGTLLASSGGALVIEDEPSGRPVSIPFDAVETLQVSRRKGPGDAFRRGAIAGTIMGVGTAGFLETLCRFTCRGGTDKHDVLLPSVLAGAFVGALMTMRGPGSHWVTAPVAAVAPGPEPASLSLSVRVPSRSP